MAAIYFLKLSDLYRHERRLLIYGSAVTLDGPACFSWPVGRQDIRAAFDQSGIYRVSAQGGLLVKISHGAQYAQDAMAVKHFVNLFIHLRCTDKCDQPVVRDMTVV